MFEISDKVLQKMRGHIYGKLAGRPHQVIEDVISDAYVRLVEALDKFEGRSTLETYAYTIADRAVVDHIRWKYQQRRLLDHEKAFFKDTQDKKTPMDIFEFKQLFQQKQNLLDKLTPKQRRLVQLVVFDGMSTEEAGKVLGYSQRWTAQIIRNIRDKFVPKSKPSQDLDETMEQVEVHYWNQNNCYKKEITLRPKEEWVEPELEPESIKMEEVEVHYWSQSKCYKKVKKMVPKKNWDITINRESTDRFRFSSFIKKCLTREIVFW